MSHLSSEASGVRHDYRQGTALDCTESDQY